MKRNYLTLTVAIAIAGATACTANAVDIIWDGGNGNWNDFNWNGGQDAFAVFGRTNGLEVGGTEIGTDAYINDGDVSYDPNVFGDFRYKNGGTLNVSGGASFSIFTTDSTADGWWTEFDGDAINLDNASFVRGFTPDNGALSGGAMILGSWRSTDNQRIEVNLANGSSFSNDGQLWFGAPSDNAPGIQSIMTISDSSVDLTGGDNLTLDNDGVLFMDADVVFAYSWNGDTMEPNGEEYAVNFTGPGTFTVDAGGIIAPVQDEFGLWDFNVLGDFGLTQMTYEELYTAGILQANGQPGASGLAFTRYFSTTGSPGADDYTLTSTVPNAPIVWDGGDGNWNDFNWNTGQDAFAVLGRTNGFEFGTAGEIGTDVTIGSGTVTYDPNTFGDFRFRRGGTLTITGGATFKLNTTDDTADGYWTEWDGAELNIDNATFQRGFTPDNGAVSGGALILGSWRSYDGQKIAVNITNGGRLENDGQLWFGAPSDNGAGIEVIMTINDGDLDLTGGDNLTLDNDGALFIDADLLFAYSWNNDANAPNDETYAINFLGPGSITVDTGGIIAPVQDDIGLWDFNVLGGVGTDLLSYEDLWDVGILQALGLSGLDGEVFADYFVTENAPGQENYKLISLLGAVTAPADFNKDGTVDGADFLIWQANFNMSGTPNTGDADGNGVVDGSDFLIWQAAFGSGAASGGGSAAVPEPAGIALLLAAVAGLLARRNRR